MNFGDENVTLKCVCDEFLMLSSFIEIPKMNFSMEKCTLESLPCSLIFEFKLFFNVKKKRFDLITDVNMFPLMKNEKCCFKVFQYIESKLYTSNDSSYYDCYLTV